MHYVHADACRGQKRASMLLGLELQVVASPWVEVLGTGLKFFARAVSALNY